MLRGMVLENFVHFKERFFLNFSKTKHCPNFFVGASSTGKTAVLELIRRCMDKKLNSSVTNRFSENETAYVFCEFDKIGEYGPTVISGMIVDMTQDDEEETSSRNLNEDDKEDDEEDEEWIKKVEVDKEDTMFHKVIMYFYGGKIKFCSKTYLKKKIDDRIVDLKMNVTLGQDLLDGILDDTGQTFLIDSEEKISKGIKDLFNGAFAKKVSVEIRKLQKENKTYNRYPKVWEELENKFVGVLSMRGLGTFQWTKSRLIVDEFKSNNYNQTCAQAEIIGELIGSDNINKEKEEQIFDFLTGGNKFLFRKTKDSKIVVKSNREFPLLKTSVGIIEAKQFSLLMADETLQTVCLEEPDRGMHPQMIQRMKEVLHHESSNKTIIVVTHSPYFIDSMSLRHTFFFSRKNDVAFAVNIYDKLKTNKYFKIVKLEDMKAILFSSKVLFVEGITDKIVLEAIIRHLKQRSSKTYEDILPILSHEICFMGGKELKENVSEFCNRLNINFCLVLDRNAFIETEESTKCIKKISQDFSSYYTFNGGLVSDFLKDPNGFEAFSTDLAKSKKTFIWKDGDLEDFLLSCSEKRSEILEIFKLHDRFTNAEDEENYNIMKTTIKESLTKGLSRDTLDDLADKITEFSETKRLYSFLKDI